MGVHGLPVAFLLVACGGPPQPSGTVLAMSYGYDLAVDGTALVWTTQTGVDKLALGDPSAMPVVLATGGVVTQRLAIDSTAVYFTNQGDDYKSDGSVVKVGRDGTGMMTLADQVATPIDIALSATHVYWAGGNGVFRVPVAGGATEVVAAGFEAGAIAINDTYIFLANYADGSLDRFNLDGSGQLKLADVGTVTSLALDATSVYWTTDDSFASITSVSIDGGTPMPLAMQTDDNVGHFLAVDDSDVYWTTTRTVERVRLDGTGREVLSAAEPAASGIALDGQYVYWVSEQNGEIKRLAK